MRITMKLTLTHYETTSTIETEHDDVTAGDAVEMCRRLLIASGYHPRNIDDYIDLEGRCTEWTERDGEEKKSMIEEEEKTEGDVN